MRAPGDRQRSTPQGWLGAPPDAVRNCASAEVSISCRTMTPYRMLAQRSPEAPDADVARFAARARRDRCRQRAAALAILAALCAGTALPLFAPAQRVAINGQAPSPLVQRDRMGRLPVQASVLWPGMCGPDRYESSETRFALDVAGLEECPWF
jgi:hypothetical protein